MPGSVRNAVSAAVFPVSLSRAFSHSRELLAQENSYADGERQIGLQVATSRKRWTIAKRLAAADMATLRQFYIDRGGPLEAFEFTDPFDGVLYLVRFEGEWAETVTLGRGEVSISLIQVA